MHRAHSVAFAVDTLLGSRETVVVVEPHAARHLSAQPIPAGPAGSSISEDRTGRISRVESVPVGAFSTRVSDCFSGIPVGMTIRPPGLSCESSGGGISSEAVVTMVFSEGANPRHP